MNREIKDTPICKPTRVVRCEDCEYVRLRVGYGDRYVCTRWGKNKFCGYGQET